MDKRKKKKAGILFLTQGSQSDNRCQAEKIMSCEWNVFSRGWCEGGNEGIEEQEDGNKG